MAGEGPDSGAELRGGVRPLLFPRSLALVGASERNLRPVEGAFRGALPVHLVNPNREEIAGRPCVARIADLAEPPETALMLVGQTRLEQAVRDALEAGVRAFVVPGLGAEAGADAPVLAERITALVGEAGGAFIGPNCMGVAVPDGASTWIGTVPGSFVRGHVSVVAQSGSIAEALLACGPRVGFRCVVSSGAERSRDCADLVAFLAEDPETRAIGLFLEAVRRPDAFAAALGRCAELGKPVVCLKVGRSEAAARATLAHTGALVGSARAFSALLRRYGALEVDDVHDLVETLEVLGRSRWPRGLRVAAVSESGGECALLADHGATAGLAFEPLPDEVASSLKTEFPNFVRPVNPLDAWAVAEEGLVYPRALELLARSGAYDVLLAQVDLSQFRGADEAVWCELIVRALADAVGGSDVFGAVVSVHASDPPPSIAALARSRDLALLRGTAHAAQALAAVARWRPASPAGAPASGIDLSDLVAPGPNAEHESALALERYGVPFAERRRCATAQEAALAAAELGFPVVVKRDGPAHKASGGVVLGLETGDAARAAAERLGGRVLVARHVNGRLEAFAGVARDPAYGPVLAVGLGGTAVEALDLVGVCLAPVDLELAEAVIAEAPGLGRLVEPSERRALAQVLVALGRLASEHPEVAACEVNPVVLGPGGAVAVDALVVGGGSP